MNINQIIISIITLVILNWLWDQRIKRKKLLLTNSEKPDTEVLDKQHRLQKKQRKLS